jgi:hypothetical protein
MALTLTEAVNRVRRDLKRRAMAAFEAIGETEIPVHDLVPQYIQVDTPEVVGDVIIMERKPVLISLFSARLANALNITI